MQNRGILEDKISVLEAVRPSIFSEPGATKSLDALIAFFNEHEDPQYQFTKKKRNVQSAIKKQANTLRFYLVSDFLYYQRSASIEGAVYDALLLLAKCFPLNAMNEQNEIISPMGSKISGDDCFVAANGYWFSAQEMAEIYQKYQENPGSEQNAIYHYISLDSRVQFDFVVRDFDRFYGEFTPSIRKKRDVFSEDATPFAALTSLAILVAVIAVAVVTGAAVTAGLALGGWVLLVGVGILVAGYIAGFGLYYAGASMNDAIRDHLDNKKAKADADKDADRDAALAELPSVSLPAKAAPAGSNTNNPVIQPQVAPSPVVPTVDMAATPSSSGSDPRLFKKPPAPPPREPGVALTPLPGPNKTPKSFD